MGEPQRDNFGGAVSRQLLLGRNAKHYLLGWDFYAWHGTSKSNHDLIFGYFLLVTG